MYRPYGALPMLGRGAVFDIIRSVVVPCQLFNFLFVGVDVTIVCGFPFPTFSDGRFLVSQSRCFAGLSLLVSVLLVHVPLCSAEGTRPPATRPNIVFILADDLGWRDVGYAGAQFFETPRIDQLASQGMIFRAAYSGGPNCSPTRACLMSGTYTPRHHIYTPGGRSKGNVKYMRLLVRARQQKDQELSRRAREEFPITNDLDPNFVCIPEILKTVGYRSARLGKWHLGKDTQGFDLSSANGKGGPEGSFYGRAHVTDQLTSRALQFIEENRRGPFFLYLSLWDVHTPLRAKQDLVEKYRRKLEGLPQPERDRFHPVYAAMIEQVDTCVGRVVDKIDELGLAPNTLIVFASDNGGTPVSQLAPLRGVKGSLFEAGIRIPTCMRWTGTIPAGSTCDTPITSVDYLPTFARLAGAALPKRQPVDGQDISLLMRGGKIPERAIFWHYPLYLQGQGLTIDLPDGGSYSWRGFPSSAIRRGDWKLVEFHEDHSIGLYNLRNDVSEANNLARTRPRLASRLLEELHAWQAVTKAPIPSIPNPQCTLTSTKLHGERPPAPPLAGQGIMVGELTPRSAYVQVRLTQSDHLVDRDVPGAEGVVAFTLRTEQGTGLKTITVKADEDWDFIARVFFDGLTPGTRYRCTTAIGPDENHLRPGPQAEFQTLPGADQAKDVRFVVVTGMNYAKFHGDSRIDLKEHLLENNTALAPPYNGPDKYLGYPTLRTILSLRPDFFVGTGDNVYYDTPNKPRAKTVSELRRKWHEQFVQPRYRDLFAAVPTYWEIDDHDYRTDDCDNTGDELPTPQTAQRMILEQLPVAAHGEKPYKMYRTHRVSKDLQIWFVEGRVYRSPNAMPDGPEKTIWGRQQKEWLKRTLAESDATFKILISPTPMIGPDDLRKKDNHTNIGGFRHERDEFFRWLKESGIAEQGFAIICGDRHWQYHAIDPSGLEEFSCGALIDENSRPGRKAGDPKSTDPDALIQQPYLQNPTKSGGFLLVHAAPAKPGHPPELTFHFLDEEGEEFYRHTKRGK